MIWSQSGGSSPSTICKSVRQTPQARTRRRTWPGLSSGRGTSRTSSGCFETSCGEERMAAFIWISSDRCLAQGFMHQETFCDFHHEQVRDCCRSEECEIDRWKRCKPQSGPEWQEWQNNPQNDNAQSGGRKRAAGAAAERVSAGPDHKQHQRLRGQRLDEPTCMKFCFLSVQ